jgi:hypothetical protein
MILADGVPRPPQKIGHVYNIGHLEWEVASSHFQKSGDRSHQVEDATSDIDTGQDPRFGCGTVCAVRFGKPWRQGLPECYVEPLDALKHYYYALSDMRADLVSIREGLSDPEGAASR